MTSHITVITSGALTMDIGHWRTRQCVVNRSGVTFDVELCIPWDAPEAVVDINSAEVVTLGSFPDKVGLFGRRKDAAVSRILQGRDSRSIRFLVPDARGLDKGFHNVTIVDMDDEREPTVTPADMTRLRELWPPEIFNHMRWFQQDLELMRKSAKREFSQLRPMLCKFCGKVIRVDMYRRGQTPPGSCAAMEMSNSLVYDVERFSSRLFGACTKWPRCSVDIKDRQY